MAYKFLCFFCIIVLVSCGKNEQEDLLTDGTWVLAKSSPHSNHETVNFSGHGNYIIESDISFPGQIIPLKGVLTGKWILDGKKISFLSTVLNLPKDTGLISLDPYRPGEPSGAFLGYILDGIYKDDSTLIDSNGQVRFSNLRDRPAFQPQQSGTRFWEILRLTQDSLVVECNRLVNRYYRSME
jgi:hypothetical protein